MIHLSDERLNEFLDKALSVAEQRAAAEHLAACPACAARAEQLGEFFAVLETLPAYVTERAFAPAVLSQLQDRARLPRSVRWLTVGQVGGAVLAAILAWPLLEGALQTLDTFPALPSLAEMLARLAATLMDLTPQLRIPEIAFEGPVFGAQLNSSTLILALAGGSLFWLLGNGFLLIPFSRRRR